VSPRHLDALRLPVVEAARALVGCTVAHGGASGVIVETEAYHESEPACHAFVGVTARTRVLFGAPGAAYVYRSYGIHALLNVVVEPRGTGAAVLVRALEPLTAVDAMRARRRVARDVDLCNGPGKLTQALAIGLEHDATDLRAGPVRLGPPPPGWEAPAVVAGERIGITKAADLPWRFCARSEHVSRPWPAELRDAARSRRGRAPPRHRVA
jgi:DNA-3-methyladenine glycosylase